MKSLPKRFLLSSLLVSCAAVAISPAPAQSAGTDPSYTALSLDVAKDRSGVFWVDLNGDTYLDLLISDDSRFIIYWFKPGAGYTEDSMQTIPDETGGALYDLADLDHDSVSELVVMSATGVEAYGYDKAAGKLVKRPKPLLEGLRGIQAQHLVPADFIFDIDRDGDDDLVYPLDGKYYLYFQKDGAFTKTNQLATKPVRISMTIGDDRLRETIDASLTIPRLVFADLNGDGRFDLRATNDNRESFYLQSAEGVIPENPSYEVDLKRFKDQAPKQEGQIKIDQFQFVPGDLDGDGREDYMIVAGNKIWVFKATAQGVDFSKPDQIVKVSAEYMSAVLLPVNEDARPDLVIVKYQVPSLGRIVAGLAIGFRFEVEFLGYNNVLETVFSRRPDYRSTMVFKIPPIFKLLGELDSLGEQVKQIEKRSKALAGGDFNGDGRRDVLKLQENSLDGFVTTDANAEIKTDIESDVGDSKFFKRVLFGEKRRDVDLDTLMKFFSDTVNSFQEAAVAGRKPSFQIPVAPGIAGRCRQLSCYDMNGDGADDIVLFLGPPKDKENEFIETQTLAFWLSQSGPKP